MKRRSAFFILLLTVVSSAQAAAPEDLEIPRKVIAFYDPSPGIALHQSPNHQHLEVILNHFGLDVEHRATTDPLPTSREMAGVRAIVSWFFGDRAVPDPRTYCSWVSRQMDAGVKWVSLNKPGLFASDSGEIPPECERLFEKLGARFLSERTEDPLFMEIVSKDSGMVEFERSLSLAEGLIYALVRPVDPALKCYLTMRRSDLERSDSCLAFTTPRGGFVQSTFVTYEDKALGKNKWRINPFRFFAEALELDGLPTPDVTTLNGRRMFMSHIDGDGIFNVSQIDRESYSGEVILKEILAAYPHVPFSVSVITGYLDMSEYAGEREMKLYHDLFAPRNVEVASHGYAHPLVWSKGTVALRVPGYRVDPKFEIQGSVAKMRWLMDVLGLTKTVESFFWTGDCLPTEEHLGFADDTGLLAVNGGDSRNDRVEDSYSFLKPIGLKRGTRRQIYASFGNENVFTNLWKGPYYGYRDIIGSFDRTESPIRIKPIDVYYHFYSGERGASLIELKNAYDHALSGPVFPVFMSRYVRMARDFFTTRIERIPGGFRVRTGGDLRTVRLDGGTTGIDMARSTGVLGYKGFSGGLYVHLDDGRDHEIYPSAGRGTVPYLVESSFDVSGWKRKDGGVLFHKSGWLNSEAVLGGFSPKANYRVASGGDSVTAVADGNGLLHLSFETTEDGGEPVAVDVKKL